MIYSQTPAHRKDNYPNRVETKENQSENFIHYRWAIGRRKRKEKWRISFYQVARSSKFVSRDDDAIRCVNKVSMENVKTDEQRRNSRISIRWESFYFRWNNGDVINEPKLSRIVLIIGGRQEEMNGCRFNRWERKRTPKRREEESSKTNVDWSNDSHKFSLPLIGRSSGIERKTMKTVKNNFRFCSKKNLSFFCRFFSVGRSVSWLKCSRRNISDEIVRENVRTFAESNGAVAKKKVNYRLLIDLDRFNIVLKFRRLAALRFLFLLEKSTFRMFFFFSNGNELPLLGFSATSEKNSLKFGFSFYNFRRSSVKVFIHRGNGWLTRHQYRTRKFSQAWKRFDAEQWNWKQISPNEKQMSDFLSFPEVIVDLNERINSWTPEIS